MGNILDDGKEPDEGRRGMAEGQSRRASTPWLAGVTTFDGGDGARRGQGASALTRTGQ